jgi:flagellin-like hook-associated protein FlgL
MKGIVEASRSQSASERDASQTQLTELTKQVQNLVDDASYKGLNLLNSDSSKLSVRFSEKTDSKLEVSGVDFNTAALFLDTTGAAVNATSATIAQDLGFTGALDSYDFTDATELASFNSEADTVVQNLESTVSNLRAKAATLAANSDVLKVRLDFTKEYVDTLKTGADKLRLADLNEEAANLLALQTRQQIGVQALSFAGQSEQSILSLFR